ncbi:polymeric immunoglobulin receptor-like isoform X2 [Brienomyrus brachyistius]|uniref:polymeric immunoglobulin receptor-like isoform X2 n=1 Tax=Brienomyrus brachyistius TaxID=42636 RepID=UPI0020B2020C|nr:polymeric immunoglobulin receptor-like isoform X2 [Brienomyrus brachyistius]
MDPLMLLFLLIAGLTALQYINTSGTLYYWECRKDSYPVHTTGAAEHRRRRHGPNLFQTEIVGANEGADSVYTMRQVSVQIGESVTIPCFYGGRYKTHLKSWCRGRELRSCTPIVHTDSPQEAKVSVRDDPDQQVVTVTIKSLTAGDSGWYWCRVEINGGSDTGDQVYLSVTDGSPDLSVDKQEVTEVEGDSVSFQCHYTHSQSQLKWCKAGGFCAAVNSESLGGRPVLIRDDRVNKVFNVTMKGLERKDTGWYWCTAEIWQIPVYVTVSQTATTTTITDRESNEKLRWEQVLDAVLKAGTGVFYLICTIIAIQLHWSSYRKRGSNQRKAEGGANTNHGS